MTESLRDRTEWDAIGLHMHEVEGKECGTTDIRRVVVSTVT
jgi:hypothetical protein